MDFENDGFRERQRPTEVFRWMGWLYTIVGCFIVALLVLMFLDMSNHSREQNIQQYYQEQGAKTIQGNTLGLTPDY